MYAYISFEYVSVGRDEHVQAGKQHTHLIRYTDRITQLRYTYAHTNNHSVPKYLSPNSPTPGTTRKLISILSSISDVMTLSAGYCLHKV